MKFSLNTFKILIAAVPTKTLTLKYEPAIVGSGKSLISYYNPPSRHLHVA